VLKWIVAALLVSAALSACGGSSGQPTATESSTVPITFTTTTTVPTTTAPAPTRTAYLGPEGVPVETGSFLAAATTTRLGAFVDGVQCQSIAQLAYTAYAHLQVYVGGRSVAIPGGIGLVGVGTKATARGLVFTPKTCMYWLHTRAADGIIQVQSPVKRAYTLGILFRIWNQPLSSDQVAGAHGPVSAMVDGVRWHGDPSAIPLREHEDIQLAVGTPVPPYSAIDWVATGL
jgi:hypothetical protein